MDGITDTDTSRLSRMAKVMAMAISLNNWPASSWIKITGKNTATVVAVEASTAPHTSLAPS
jgi:hypothetical protein